MEHIVQFAIGIDDDAIKKRIEQTAEKQVVDGIKEDICDKIFIMSRLDRNRYLQDWVKDIVVDTIIEKHKDEIIKEAASQLCEYMKRTKAVREAVAGAVEDSK